ncbi:hypothetical protein QTP86_018812 [Hemibagrus guttatus]|nr:hypothetical protein QTP86_018812 [Hemibagrus guttatus]
MTEDNAGETEYFASRRNYHPQIIIYYTELSDPVKITVKVRPKPVTSINPDNQVFSGETVTLRCDIQDESVSSWQYSWDKDASHSPVSSVQVYRISGVEVTHTGKYTCRGAERGGSRSSHSSDAVTLTVSGPKSSVGTVGLVVGLGFFFITLLILMILLWSHKRKKGLKTALAMPPRI